MKQLELLAKRLLRQIDQELFRIGFLFRSYFRCKEMESIQNKIIRKNYSMSGGKIQDVIGIRINLYFVDDIPLVVDFLKDLFELDNHELDTHNDTTFQPTRNNLVFKIPEGFKNEFTVGVSDLNNCIDCTFEVQIRSVLSEGWHEVEHDLRYKHHSNWEKRHELSRILNGIYATLETSEWAMLQVFSKLSYNNYKEKEWEPLIRNTMRLRIKSHPPLNQKLIEIFNSDKNLTKEIQRIKRSNYLKQFIGTKFSVPITYDNIVFTINHLFIHNHEIVEIVPANIQGDLDVCFPKK